MTVWKAMAEIREMKIEQLKFPSAVYLESFTDICRNKKGYRTV